MSDPEFDPVWILSAVFVPNFVIALFAANKSSIFVITQQQYSNDSDKLQYLGYIFLNLSLFAAYFSRPKSETLLLLIKIIGGWKLRSSLCRISP